MLLYGQFLVIMNKALPKLVDKC